MNSTAHWEKGILSNTTKIFRNQKELGMMSSKIFRLSAQAKLLKNSYRFNPLGTFNTYVQIIDRHKNEVVGSILFDNFMNKATINLSGKTYLFIPKNGFQTKWIITDENKQVVLRIKNSMKSGQIISKKEQDLLMLSSLYVIHFIQQQTYFILLIAVFPIFTTLFFTLGVFGIFFN